MPQYEAMKMAPPDLTTTAGRNALGPHSGGRSTNTPEMKAYMDANTSANRARADRFGNDFYRAAGNARAARGGWGFAHA